MARPDYRSAQASEYRHWYNSARWKGPHGRRAEQLAREPLCRMCVSEGRVTAGTVADHVIPHRGDERLFWEQEDLKSHELPNVPKMDINSGSYPIFARGLGLRSDGLARAIWDHLGPLTTTVSGTVGGPPGVGSAARTSNFERGEV